MADDKQNTSAKKPDEEEKDKKSETAEQDQKEEPPKDNKSEEKAPDDKQEKSDDQTSENGEGAPAEETPKEEDKSEETESETTPEVPQMSETDKLKAENLTLKTQLEAMKIGFNPDCMEDAVTLAEAIVKRDGTDISAALQAVAKKYPDWKADGKEKSKSGFKVGADSGSDSKKTDSDKLSQAFGIKKKGKV